MASPRIAFGQELRELDDRLLAMGKEAESMLGMPSSPWLSVT